MRSILWEETFSLLRIQPLCLMGIVYTGFCGQWHREKWSGTVFMLRFPFLCPVACNKSRAQLNKKCLGVTACLGDTWLQCIYFCCWLPTAHVNRNFCPGVRTAINRALQPLGDPARLQRQNTATAKAFGYYRDSLSTTKELTADLSAVKYLLWRSWHMGPSTALNSTQDMFNTQHIMCYRRLFSSHSSFFTCAVVNSLWSVKKHFSNTLHHLVNTDHYTCNQDH